MDFFKSTTDVKLHGITSITHGCSPIDAAIWNQTIVSYAATRGLKGATMTPAEFRASTDEDGNTPTEAFGWMVKLPMSALADPLA